MDVTVLGVLEFNSIAIGIRSLDAMAKAASIRIIDAKPICPGKYMIIIAGELAAVDASLTAGKKAGDTKIVDELLLPNLHTQIIPAIIGAASYPSWNAIGIFEALSVTASIEAGDVAAKIADIFIPEIRLAVGLGGKSFVKMVGEIGEVETAMQAALTAIGKRGLVCSSVVIPNPDPSIREFFLT
ncbi:MAG: BMC domain-containing protein [Spirochaetota bacterium]|jgi:microcompartment protein CcmL/EutN|nr:BMC domain-containing protein [Spirochaetota bacterium]